MIPSDELTAFFANLPAFNPIKWVECKIKDPIKKAIALGAVEAYEVLTKKEHIQTADLAPILKAVRHSSTVVADVGTERLMDLAEKHSIVLDTLRELFASKKGSERFIVIAYLHQSFPRDFLLEIVGKGLIDKSCKIRWKAAQACGGIGLTELLPLLKTRLSIEQNAEALFELQQNIGILTNGYYLSYTNGSPWLAIKKTNSQIIIMGLRQEQLDREGVEAIYQRRKDEP